MWRWLIMVYAICGQNGLYISRRTTARGPIQSAVDAVSKPELGNFPVLAHDRSTHSSLTALSPGNAGHTAQMGFIESVFQSDSYSSSLLIYIIIYTQSNDGVHNRVFL